MCCLFGLLDTQNRMSGENKTKLLHLLALEAEARGTDASGVAYHDAGRLVIRKAPVPGHKLKFRIPDGTVAVMGHTRMTTQGNEKINRNNHPFRGKTRDGAFALAHNGVLWNDKELRETLYLPPTNIETDSYIAVQLIELQRSLDFFSLKYMAEQIEGSFTFTALDASDSLYIVKGDSPLCIYRLPASGLYVYASTEAILLAALSQFGMSVRRAEKVKNESGGILKINQYGRITRGNFDDAKLRRNPWGDMCCVQTGQMPLEQEELRKTAAWLGYPLELIDCCMERGYTPSEIRELLDMGNL